MTASSLGRLAATAIALGTTMSVCLALPPAPAERPLRPSDGGPHAVPRALALAAHRAAYKLTLSKALGSKSPTSAEGRVSYEFNGSECEGYSQVFRQVTEMQPAEGDTRLSDMRSATFETPDEKSFSFDVKTTVDGNPPDVVDGHANKKRADILAISLSKPNAQTVDVGDEVLFPTAHLKRIIATARAGQHILGVKVFDGSDDGKKVFETTTIIGRPITQPADDVPTTRAGAMASIRRWPVSVSYFEPGKKDSGPAYTLAFELYENGVSRALRFDYGDFILSGELTKLELLPGKACRK